MKCFIVLIAFLINSQLILSQVIDKDTINQIGPKGKKQGYWIKFNMGIHSNIQD